MTPAGASSVVAGAMRLTKPMSLFMPAPFAVSSIGETAVVPRLRAGAIHLLRAVDSGALPAGCESARGRFSSLPGC